MKIIFLISSFWAFNIHYSVTKIIKATEHVNGEYSISKTGLRIIKETDKNIIYEKPFIKHFAGVACLLHVGELAVFARAVIIFLLLVIVKYDTEIWSSLDTFVNPKGHKIDGSLLGNLSDFHHGFGP